MGIKDIRMGNKLFRWALKYPDGQKIIRMGNEDIRMGNTFSQWAVKILGWAIFYCDGQFETRSGFRFQAFFRFVFALLIFSA